MTKTPRVSISNPLRKHAPGAGRPPSDLAQRLEALALAEPAAFATAADGDFKAIGMIVSRSARRHGRHYATLRVSDTVAKIVRLT